MENFYILLVRTSLGFLNARRKEGGHCQGEGALQGSDGERIKCKFFKMNCFSSDIDSVAFLVEDKNVPHPWVNVSFVGFHANNVFWPPSYKLIFSPFSCFLTVRVYGLIYFWKFGAGRIEEKLIR